MIRVKYGDDYIFIDNSPLDVKETGVMEKIYDSPVDKTEEIPVISKQKILCNTMTNIWGDYHEKS